MDCFSISSEFCKVKSMISSFFSFFLWSSSSSSSFRFPMHSQKPQFSLPGLKTLVFSPQQEEEDRENTPQVIRNVGIGIIKSMPSIASSTSSPIGFCSDMDDLIGTESGVCLTSNSEEMEKKSTIKSGDHQENIVRDDFSEKNQYSVAQTQFPPPIPFILPSNRIRTPWILTRHYMDGRLILKLENTIHHQYLESHRENGRLILNLVPTVSVSDDDAQDLQFIEEDGENEETEEDIKSIDYEEDGEIEEARVSAMASKSFTYGGGSGSGEGMLCDRSPFCGSRVNRKIEERHVDRGYFGSAPLRPMGTVM